MTQVFRKLFFKEKRGIVLGGAGALGSSVLTRFRKTWDMTCVDFVDNREARANIRVRQEDDLCKQAEEVKGKLTGKYDFIFCAAGTWCNGDVESQNVFSQFGLNLRSNPYPSLLASHLASHFLSEMGVLVLTGSLLAYKEETPSMLAYGVSKNIVHSVALNMSTQKDLTSETTVICLLPDILNTETNRKAMPTADYTKWVHPDKIADLLYLWTKGVNTPKNGSFVGFKQGKEVIPEFL